VSTYVFKINPEHCPENAFDRREADLWEAGEFKVPWPTTLEKHKLRLDEIRPGDECWIWLHVERRKEKNRRSPGLVGRAFIDHRAPAEDGLLSVRFSRVDFRKTAVLREEFKKHQERSNTVKDLLKFTTRRVAALNEDQVKDFESFVNWLDDEKLRQIRRLQGQDRSHQDPDQTEETEYALDRNHEVLIEHRTDIGPTEKQSLQKARRGQGIFRKNVKEIERACRVTGVDDVRHLRASHIKPWRDSSDFEKLDGSNGLLLSPHVDHLFDQGFISFGDTGELLISPDLAPDVLEGWGVSADTSCGEFRESQRVYLAYHRNQVFKL